MKLYEQFNLLSPWTWNNRLHDKIIIADEKLALIGGRNIGDKYFLQESMKDGFVKDRDVLIFRESDSPSVIGSFNFDSRSSYINSESMVVISGKEFTDQLMENVAVDLNKSLRVDKDYTYIESLAIAKGQVSWPKQLMIWFVSKIAFFVEYLL